MMNQRNHCIALITMLATLFIATGCSTTGSNYKLRGRVIEGPQSMVIIVEQDDPRLQNAGIANVPLDLVIDPRSVSRSFIRDTSGPNGDFAVPINATGAGFLRYDARVNASALGFVSATQTIEVPSSDKRVLIMLTTGRDRGTPMRDMRDEFSVR